MLSRRVFLGILGLTVISLAGCSGGGAPSAGEGSTIEESVGSLEDPKHEAVSDEESEPVDEFVMVDAHREPADENGYFEMVVTARNNMDKPETLQGVSIGELDADGNIIDSYMSYNKNAVEALVMPGQEVSIPLTCHVDDGIAGVQCAIYAYGDDFSDMSEGKFSEPFVKMF